MRLPREDFDQIVLSHPQILVLVSELTDERRKNDIQNFTHARDRLLIATTDVDATGKRDAPNTDLALLDPLEPAKARKVTTLPGTGWGTKVG